MLHRVSCDVIVTYIFNYTTNISFECVVTRDYWRVTGIRYTCHSDLVAVTHANAPVNEQCSIRFVFAVSRRRRAVQR